MILFKIENNDQLESITEQPFKLEKEIQSLSTTSLSVSSNLWLYM